ncbi:MAG: NmrA family NAD(P)-binding protein [Niastella sp.]|nr:NmrA family NAD(P)-binding protein [Niastella sp.]
MYIILGATGHVGSAVAKSLLQEGKEVIVVTRSTEKAAEWEKRGARVAVVDIHQKNAFRKVLQKGSRLFLLNPPAPPNSDTVQEEMASIAAIFQALEGSGIEKVVAESTYGAQPGIGIGDLGVLYDMEQGLHKLDIPVSIIRAGYYMSNWDSAYDSVVKEGKLYSFFPPDHRLGMVAPQDIGKVAARLLMAPTSDIGLHYVEGPQLYSPGDVAAAFGKALGKTIEVVPIPPDQWESAMQQAGFSPKAAASMAAMTRIVIGADFEVAKNPIRGVTTIEEYVREMIDQQQGQPA